MMIRTLLLCAICTLAPLFSLMAEPLSVAKIFSDNMILQQQADAPIWGWAEPDAKVVVKPSWASKSYTAKADKDGAWRVEVKTPSYGGPYSVNIACGKERLELKDVLIGEVWICSGQSNMEMPISGFVRYSQPVEQSLETCLDALKYGDKIRIFTVPRNPQDKAPAKDMPSGEWKKASFASCAECSAVAYHFAHTLTNAIDIPVGVVIASWGGTRIRPWTPRDCYEKVLKELVSEGLVSKEEYATRTAYTKPYKNRPTSAGSLYNGMINPIKGFKARGFLWYQGCSNKKDYKFYDRLQNAMVARWREEWGDKEAKMPFYYVLIAPFWGKIKEAENSFARGYFVENQISATKLTPNSDYASTECFGSKFCIHPAKKLEVGRQLALLALDRDYGVEGIDAGTPKLVKVTLKKRSYVLEFEKGKGLMVPPNDEAKGFEIAGEDKVFYPATALVWGNRIVVNVPDEVTTPQSLRYAFRNYAEGNIRSRFDFPLAPFRTDKWELK